MKKRLSVILSVIMLISCMSIGSYSALANTVNTASKATLNKTVSATIDSNAEMVKDLTFYLAFTPEKTGYYEFKCSSSPSKGMVMVVITNKNETDIFGMGICDPTDKDFKAPPVAAAKLTAKKTYYFAIVGEECGKYTTNITVTKHTHKYYEMDLPAANYQEDDLKFNGGRYRYCESCDYEKVLKTYYYPKTVTLSTTSYTYNGKKKAPKVTVKDSKGNVISSSNYKVKYKNNTKPGKATITITFNDKKYSGTLTKTFKIKPKKQTLSSVKSKKSKQITIKWKRDANVSGYQLQYSTDKKFKKNTKSVTISKNKTTSKTISKLKSKKKYYVRIRAYKTIDGKKVYGAWAGAKSVTTKK